MINAYKFTEAEDAIKFLDEQRLVIENAGIYPVGQIYFNENDSMFYIPESSLYTTNLPITQIDEEDLVDIPNNIIEIDLNDL